MAEQWEFEEAIESFKVIDTSLRCVYAGEQHMYRAIAAQLRILFCDNNPKPLLLRLFPELHISPLQEIKPYEPGSFSEDKAFLSTLKVSSATPVTFSCMPFEVTRFFNGEVDCRVLFSDDEDLIPISEWVEQKVSLYPEHSKPLSICEVIKTVAERGGGAHVHKSKDDLLEKLKHSGPYDTHIGKLIIVALGRVAQKIGFSVIQVYERFGTNGILPLPDFDLNHPSVQSAAKVPAEYYEHPREIYNLVMLTACEGP